MIEYVRLKNFQRFGQLHIAFVPGVNVIVGDTGAGKSTLIRSLYWGCLGGPAGSYPMHGLTGRCDVRLGADGRNVLRSRGKSTNLYRLDGKEFNAVGVNVPEEVSNALNMCPLNFQRQLDPPFLVTAPAPDVSRLLNRVVNLDLIDRTLGALDASVRKAREDSRRADEAREQAESDLTKTDWAEDASKDLEALEVLKEEFNRQDRLFRRLQDARLKMESLRAEERRNRTIGNHATHFRNLMQEHARHEARRASLESYRVRILELSVREPPPMSAVRKLKDLHKGYKEAQSRHVRLVSFVIRLRELEEEACRTERASARARQSLKQLQSDRCPLCGK